MISATTTVTLTRQYVTKGLRHFLNKSGSARDAIYKGKLCGLGLSRVHFRALYGLTTNIQTGSRMIHDIECTLQTYT